jgi:hypothetical protein
MLQFIPLAIHPKIPTYGATAGEHTFVITVVPHYRKYHASVKKVGAMSFDRTRVDIGYYRRFVDAARACEAYHREHSH